MSTINVLIPEATIDEKLMLPGLTLHRSILTLSATSTLIAVIISLSAVFQHATHYSKPWEQKHILRILFAIPIYAAVSFLSYPYYKHAFYFEVLQDCYGAFAIASFFTLLCHYLADNLHDQKKFFSETEPKNWIWPITMCQTLFGGQDCGLLRKPYSGLAWFKITMMGVFQYCFIRVFFITISIITQLASGHCESSFNPAFINVWTKVFQAISATVTMYFLAQFYSQLQKDLASHRPFLKLLCIKLLIFFTFWQTIVIDFLFSFADDTKFSAIKHPGIRIGIPSMLLCVEVAVFAIVHIFAFPHKEYDNTHSMPDHPCTYQGGYLGIRALLDAFNPWDIVKASARGFQRLIVDCGRHRNNLSYFTPIIKLGLRITMLASSILLFLAILKSPGRENKCWFVSPTFVQWILFTLWLCTFIAYAIYQSTSLKDFIVIIIATVLLSVWVAPPPYQSSQIVELSVIPLTITFAISVAYWRTA